jgi:hypothetical protein
VAGARDGGADFGRSTVTRAGVMGGKINDEDDEKKLKMTTFV